MSADIAAAFLHAVESLRANADPNSAPARKRYLKTDHEVLGCPVPAIREAARGIKGAARDPARTDLLAELDRLWASRVHEDRILAVLTAQQFVMVFDAADVSGKFRRWLEDCHGWDLVDGICTFVVGPVALNHPTAWVEIAKWAGMESFWMRRASLLPHVAAIRACRVDMDLLRNTCARLIDEKEFFIRKAIGWVLRELANEDPANAESLILELGPKAAGLTLREATRRLPDATRRRIYRQLGRQLPKNKKGG